ncbi:uncharacterized protein CANTADRAFT_6468 [Suhomyces tanzawaensis NRRL Y-17324]|uniref:Uncharacterized protein n=1 Tax=Suhomyces tanzawaensis NRRL Y-17324 TaxID=984487 RepID=A0A1E4SIQ6_9ASCO|nr:uncharacterized protein CANTADRAFT_6468 [Suhomyces tanzawaensis NRRL Y-17324]ODV79327.1 hypothetical protein CANTADRAFT_6468 [Suhomyces tanzawaensis NRRL Y-17324]
MAVFGSKSSSFYKKERQRIAAIIEEPLLIQVVQHLPHLQLTVEEQESKWEIVAINVNNYQFTKAFEQENAKEHIEFPTLNGLYLKEMFEGLEQNFKRQMDIRDRERMFPNSSETDAIQYCNTRSEFLLYELHRLKGYDAKVLADLGKEQYEKEQRARFEKSLQAPQGGDYEVDEDTKKLIDEFKDALEKIRLEAYEKELTKKKKRVDQLMSENKRLLELNHDLLGGKFHDRE